MINTNLLRSFRKVSFSDYLFEQWIFGKQMGCPFNIENLTVRVLKRWFYAFFHKYPNASVEVYSDFIGILEVIFRNYRIKFPEQLLEYFDISNLVDKIHLSARDLNETERMLFNENIELPVDFIIPAVDVRTAYHLWESGHNAIPKLKSFESIYHKHFDNLYSRYVFQKYVQLMRYIRTNRWILSANENRCWIYVASIWLENK